MASPAELVRTARSHSGLSVRALARRAGVAATTVTRIEAGRVDPTVGTLRSIMAAAGFDLRLAQVPLAQPHLADLSDAWTRTAAGDRPAWPRYRALLDHLARHPELVGPAIATLPPPSGSAAMDTLLAGIAERLADNAGLPRPEWAGRVPPLKRRWSTPGTPTMRRAMLKATPVQLLDRGIVLDEGSLWRDREPLGA